MRLFSILTSATALLLTSSVVSAIQVYPRKCDYDAKGRDLQRRQSAAIRDFAHMWLVEMNVQEAFDSYVPGHYIQHSPTFLPGRENAISFLTAYWAQPGMHFSNITAWAGEGTGMIHWRMRSEEMGIHNALMDRFRFEGTCFVEHWDVIQPITGDEINPIAYF